MDIFEEILVDEELAWVNAPNDAPCPVETGPPLPPRRKRSTLILVNPSLPAVLTYLRDRFEALITGDLRRVEVIYRGDGLDASAGAIQTLVSVYDFQMRKYSEDGIMLSLNISAPSASGLGEPA